MKCWHENTSEFRKSPPRFLNPAKKYSLEEVLDRPIHLDVKPFEVDSTSPTPLDPSHVFIHGVDYARVAIHEMQQRAHLQAPENVSLRLAETVLYEIAEQHSLRMQKNEEAFDRLRETAAQDFHDHMLTHAEAEGIMQVRAGVSRAAPIVKLLEKHPEIEAIEISKATRPYCSEQFRRARNYIAVSLGSLAAGSDMQVTMIDGDPYRHIVEEDSGVIVAKSIVAELSNHTELEVVRRDSFAGVDEGVYDGEAIQGQIGPIALSLVPIDTTNYVRVKASEND